MLSVIVKYYPLTTAQPALELNQVLAANKIPLFVLVPFAALRFAFQENHFCVVRKSLREVNLALVFVSPLANCNLPSDEFNTCTFSTRK